MHLKILFFLLLNSCEIDPNFLLRSASKSNYRVIQGFVDKGPVKEAFVEVRRADNNLLLGSAKTSADGGYSVDIGDYTGIIKVSSQGGRYIDEIDQTEKEAPDLVLVAISAIDEKTNHYVNLTPFTSIAAKKIEELNTDNQKIDATTVTQANEEVGLLFMGEAFDVTKKVPQILNKDPITETKEGRYGTMLAVFSKLTEGNPANIQLKINELFQHINPDKTLNPILSKKIETALQDSRITSVTPEGTITKLKQAVNASVLRLSITDDEPNIANISGGSVEFTFRFSEDIQNIQVDSIHLTGGKKGDLIIVDERTCKLVVIPYMESTDKLEIRLDKGVFTDVMGNTNSFQTTSQAVDTRVLTLALSLDNTALKSNDSATLTAHFNLPVKNFDLTDVTTLENASLSPFISTDDHKIWTATLTPAIDVVDQTNTIEISSGDIASFAGNPLSAGQSVHYSIDSLLPTIRTEDIQTTISKDLNKNAKADVGDTLRVTWHQSMKKRMNFRRSSTATVKDFEGVLKTAKVDELRYSGYRRVENFVDSSELPATQNITVIAGHQYQARIGSESTMGATVIFSGALVGTLIADGNHSLSLNLDTNKLERIDNLSVWDIGAESASKFSSDGYITAEITNTKADPRAIGLSTISVDKDFRSIQFAILLSGNTISIYESGNHKDQVANFETGDIVKIAREGSEIQYYKNNALVYTSLTQAPTEELLVDASLYAREGSLDNVKMNGRLIDWVNVGAASATKGATSTTLTATISGEIRNFQVEDVTGQTNQNPSEFVKNTWNLSYDSVNQRVYSLAEYKGKLYAGSTGRVLVFNGISWQENHYFNVYIYALSEYNGKLYAGSYHDGKIFVFDGTSWEETYDSIEQHIYSLAEYDGKLYAGTGTNGKIFVFDGTSWEETHDSADQHIYSLAEYDGKLYAGTGTNGKIFVFDGTSWEETYDSANQHIYSLAEYDGKLYAGTGTNGKIFVFDGTSWEETYDSLEERIDSLAEYDGKLYAGTAPNGKVFVFDGTAWEETDDSLEERIDSLAEYNGKLYAGTGTNGKIFVFDKTSTHLSPKYNSRQNNITVDETGVITESRGSMIADTTLKGILIEETRINLVAHSTSTGGFSLGSALISHDNNVLNPQGLRNVIKLEGVSGSQGIYKQRNINRSVLEGEIYTYSIFVKEGSTTSRKLKFNMFLAGDSNVNFTLELDLITEELSASGSFLSYGMQKTGDGWYRLSVTFEVSSTHSARTFVELLPVVNAGDVVYWWGIQLEKAPFSTSYIPTEGFKATRASDKLSYTVENFPQNFTLEMDITPLADGANYSDTEIRLFSTDDHRGLSHEVRTYGWDSYDIHHDHRGTWFLIYKADLIKAEAATWFFSLNQEGTKIRAIIKKDGIEELNRTITGTLDHSNLGILNISHQDDEYFSANIKNIHINSQKNISAITADFTELGGNATAIMYDDGTHGDEIPNDQIWTAEYTIEPGYSAGNKAVSVIVTNTAGSRSLADDRMIVFP